MKYLLFLHFCVLLQFSCLSQDFSGQWKGTFIDKSTSYGSFYADKCDYVLELEVSGNKVTGSSYTYFTESGKRYYTICKLEGFIEPKNKYLEVREVARIKTNIPSNIRNCFQVHKLTYFKQGDQESFEGNWLPAPNQDGSCGFGSTNLTRRLLKSTFPNTFVSNTPKNKTQEPVKKSSETSNSGIAKVDTRKNKTVTQPALQPEKSMGNNTNINQLDQSTANNTTNQPSGNSILDTRKNTVIKTIDVKSKTVKVDLYDNGEIDGDSISLYFNNNLILSNKKLTDKPITIELSMNDSDGENELAMFAENLGSIPPNTALMIIYDGKIRNEVRISSDLEKSGVIRFRYKP